MQLKDLFRGYTIAYVLLVILGLYILAGFFAGPAGKCDGIADPLEKELCLYSVVNGTGDPGLCESAANHTQCITFISMLTKNASYCELADSKGKDACLKSLALHTENSPLCLNISDANLENTCLADLALSLDDPGICSFIGVGNVPVTRESCFYRLAYKLEDPALCEETGDWLDKCRMIIALKTYDGDLCDSLNDTVQRDRCILHVARETRDLSLSGKVSDLDIRNYVIALWSKKIGDCLKITDPALEKRCFADMVEANGSVEICDDLPSDEYACRLSIALLNSDDLVCRSFEDPVRKDMCYHELALATGRDEFCYEIENTQPNLKEFYRPYKDKCFDEVARRYLDLDACQRITSETESAFCVEDVNRILAGKTGEIQYCDNILDDSAKKAGCYGSVGVRTLNYTYCRNMTGINRNYATEAEQCERDVFVKTVESYLDKEPEPGEDQGTETTLGGYCEEISSEQERFDCYMDLLMDIRLCESAAPGGRFAMYCYDRYSRYNDNYASCYLLKYPSYCLRKYAVKFNNASICELIMDDWEREGCRKDVIKGGGGTSDREADLAVCETMESYNRDVCFIELARKYNDYSYCLKQDDEGPFCVSEIALKLRNASICDEIRNRTDVRASCYDKIARETNNVSMCEKCASDEYYLFACFKSFFDEFRDKADCTSRISYEKEYCLANKALYEKDAILCGTIKTQFIRDVCLARIADKLGDWKICEQVSFTYERDDCLQRCAQKKKDYEICKKIKDGSSHDTCLSNVAFLTSTKEPCEHLNGRAVWYDICGHEFLGQVS